MGAGIGGMLTERTRGWQEQADRIERWLAGHYAKLEELSLIMREQGEADEYSRFAVTLTTDVNGAGHVEIPGQQGLHYELINVAVTSFTGEAGALLTYMNGPHPAGLLHVTALGQYTSDAYPEGTFVPAGVGLYVATVGASASKDLYVNILAKQLRRVVPIPTIGGGEE